ncbi:MAG: protease modulator HflC [Chloroflexi bacterium]|nr:protease modulator HflC [Chloroflexota bacterium]
MKKSYTAIIVIILIGLVVLVQSLFIVDETNTAIVTRFGEPIKTTQSPGLNFKVPFIDQVRKFEKRLLIFDAPPDSLLTSDKKRLVIDVYARGKIVDPLLFFKTTRNETLASSRAIDIISCELRREIASDLQAEIIKTSREQVMNKVKLEAEPKLREFGIQLIDVRIKRADFPDEIAESIYARMKAERKRKADKERAEAAEIDLTVRSEVDKEAAVIRAKADKEAKIIIGNAEAEAIKILSEAHSQNPEFYNFLRQLETYENSFSSGNSTIIIPENSNILDSFFGSKIISSAFPVAPTTD